MMRRVSATLAALMCATVLSMGTAVAADDPGAPLTQKEQASLQSVGKVLGLLLGGAR
ncbi:MULTISPECIES: hypothetical protein [unclassified Streptomyces]|uniref:hypothetical protein n=1 Tax=unclassified Streptomyces TaxID=2593676 RepID=UPI002DDB3BE6|nr:hypothetical protein [Streptomyces sp. NBC_01775]WSB74444.1 hypothetical protein OHB04_00735 [Streptomyces sp. NBC_01775]WSS45919.1 hypothetical protein OG220_38920 [Streptomyces sp. NBC_01187]